MQITDWFIDVDTHITEPGDVWTSRLAPRFQDRAPRMVRSDDGIDTWHFGRTTRPIPVGATAIAGWKEPFPAFPRNIDECPPASYDSKARLAYMDEIGAWACGLYPNIGGFGSESFLGLDDRDLMLACVQAYNDWLIEWIEPDPRRFIPAMAIPFWDVEAAVKEIHRGRDLGHKTVLFMGAPQEFGFPFLGDSHWEPLWKAVQDVDIPLSLHVGTGDFSDDLVNPDRFAAHGITPSIVTQSMGILLQNAIQMMDIAMSGILPRNPGLRVVSVESGIGWIPFVHEALDHGFKYADVRSEKPEFTKKPSDYLRQQVWGCTFFEEFAPQSLVDVIGADRIMFETDYPHPICLYGNVREKIDAALSTQSEEVQRKILFSNAASLYDVVEPDRPSPL